MESGLGEGAEEGYHLVVLYTTSTVHSKSSPVFWFAPNVSLYQTDMVWQHHGEQGRFVGGAGQYSKVW